MSQPIDASKIVPWSFQIELTLGCQLRCRFCGLNSVNIGRHEHKFMTPENAGIIARRISTLNNHGRIEFAMRGEPTLNPYIKNCIYEFRQALPLAQLMMVSNGIIFVQQDLQSAVSKLDGAFEAGLNIVAFDLYEPHGDKLKNIIVQMYTGDKEIKVWDLRHFSPWNNHGPVGKHIVFLPDIEKENTRVRAILNQAGNSPIGRLAKPKMKMCPLLWREMSVHYDGSVPICCDDWNEEYVLGNLVTEDIRSVWLGKKAMAARRMLRHGQRWFNPCCRCDGPGQGRNRAIPKCETATEEDYELVYETVCNNGQLEKMEWWEPVW